MLRDPRVAAAELIGLEFRREVLISAFLAMIAVSIIATEPMLNAAASIFPGDPLPPLARAFGSALGGLAIVWVIWKAGSMMGGQGTFDQLLLGFILLEVVFIAGIVGLLMMMVALPPLAGLLGVGFICYWLWLISNVYAELHGFPSAWKAFGVVVVSWMVVNYTSVIVLGLLTGLFGGPTDV